MMAAFHTKYRSISVFPNPKAVLWNSPLVTAYQAPLKQRWRVQVTFALHSASDQFEAKLI